MFTNTYLPHVGGVARSVSSFAEDLRDLGHRVLIVAPTYKEGGDHDEEGGRVLRLPAIQNFNGSDFSVRIPVPLVIREELDSFEPDIIHSHHPFMLGDSALRTARARGLPLVFTHHTLYERYTHYVPLDSKAMKRFAIRLSTEYANLCSRVIAPSESVARLLRERGVETPIQEIPTGVDTEFFARGQRQEFRKEHGIPENALVLGHLGRLAPEKNLGYLARAASLFLERNENAFFMVAGRGPSEEEIRDIFSERGFEDRLVMVGVVKGEKLSDVYHAMDIFVFASKSETQGMVLTEAMAAGKPVVALDASGAREVVRDNKNGRLLTKDASPEDFAGAVAEFANNRDLAARWGAEALETARIFSREECAKKLSGLYESVLGSWSKEEEEENDWAVSWNRLLQRVKAEWDLISEKAAAAVDAVTEDEAEEMGLE